MRGPSGGGVALAFVMGGVAALLAGACVAPVVIQVVALSTRLYSGGSQLGLVLPLILGLGMGLPWPFAGAGLAALPKPGAWMVRVKQGLGVCILLTAAYYGYEAFGLARPVSAPTTTVDGWHPSLVEGLSVARQEGKPIFLDVWATWCKNCGAMDATTFRDRQRTFRCRSTARPARIAIRPTHPREIVEGFAQRVMIDMLRRSRRAVRVRSIGASSAAS